MDSSSIASRPDVTVATTAPRVTPTPARGQFKQILSDSIVRGAETAMKILPGSPLMAVAIRGAGGSGSALGIPVTGVGSPFHGGGGGSPEGPGVGASTRSGVLGSAAASALSSATGTTASSSGFGGVVGTGTGTATGTAGASSDPNSAGIESSLQQSQEMNLYYLQIQETVNQQNRSFSTLSNVLKAEHETVKTAIGNIR